MLLRRLYGIFFEVWKDEIISGSWMNEELKRPEFESGKSRSVRPALIASSKTVSEYSMYLERLLVGLADESILTALVCPAASELGFVVPPGVEVIRHPAFELPLLWRQSRRKLVENLVNFKPSVLHCLCESEASLARWLAWELDLRYVLSVNSLQKRFGRLFISSSRCAKIIVPAKSIAANISEVYPQFCGRIEQINMGTFAEETVGCFREGGRLVSMVTAHPLNDEQDFESLFNAVKHLVIDRYEFMFVITGEGSAERRVRKMLVSLGLSPIVTMVPRMGLWRSVLAAGDIFIQPVASFSFNPLLLEAMSVGAAVASCKGGVDDLIIEDKTAVVFKADDELSIRRSLQRLFDSRQWARELAGGAQDYLRKNYKVSKMMSSMLRIYCEAQERTAASAVDND